jgi:transposase
MQVTERRSGDLAKLRAPARREPRAEQRDRLLAVVKAIEGRETLAIAEALSRSRAFVQRWVYAYRDRGIEAIAARKPGGDRSKIRDVLAERLKARLEAGPTPADKVCVLRGRDVQRIAKRELGAQNLLDDRLPHAAASWLRMPRAASASREAGPRGAAAVPRGDRPPLLSTASRSRSRRRVARPAFSSWTKRGSGSKAR